MDPVTKTAGTGAAPAVSAKAIATTSLTSMLTNAQNFMAYGPKIATYIESVATKFPDIEANGMKLVSGLAKLVNDAKSLQVSAAIEDAQSLIAAGVALYEDLGLPADLINSVSGTSPSLPSVTGVETVLGGLEKLFHI